MNTLDNTLITMLTGIFIAVVSSWVTVQLSLRKFRIEKWWERKADAYASVIEALHNSKEFSEQHLRAGESGRELSKDMDAELRVQAKAASKEIRRVADIGAFLLSDQTMGRMARLRKEEDKASDTTDWFVYLEGEWKAVSTCLDDIIAIAKGRPECVVLRGGHKRGSAPCKRQS